MTHNTIVVDAAPEQVFAVLSDAFAYEDWIVGSETVLAADADFPAKGTRFRHQVGGGPLKVRDSTEVLDVNPPFRIELIARARPLLGSAHVTLLVEPRSAASSYVTMLEGPADRPSRLVMNRLSGLLVHVRNAASLRRLKRLVEAPATAAGAGR